MCERGFRARGADDDGDLARPERPRRCTLPITALRVMPPSSPAIWLAESPSAQSFLRSSTRSSVHVMSCMSPLYAPAADPLALDRDAWRLETGRIQPRSPAT